MLSVAPLLSALLPKPAESLPEQRYSDMLSTNEWLRR